MKMPNLFVNAVATWDGKALTKGQKQVQGFEKGVKNLGKTLGVALSATALINFGKASAKAFIDDENAARSLGVTIKNLGLNYDNNAVLVGRFIDNLEQQTGVLDDELRPAMDRLLRATGSVTKSQELLNLSLDIAAGTGKSVAQVSQSLQKAYLGNTQAIGRLGVGISKAELATGKFTDIQAKLTTLFAGQALSAAESYAGQMAKLQVAANNAKETIGEGLVDALSLLGGDNSIDNLNSALEDTSLYIADVIRGIGALIAKLQSIPLAGKAFSLPLDAYVQAIPVIGAYISILANMGSDMRKLGETAGRMFTGGSGGPSRDFVNERAAKDLAKAEKKRTAAEIAAAKAKEKAAKKAELAEKARAAISKAAAVFDLNKIQIAAALKNTFDKDERLRLLAMQEIENENGEAALKYIEQLNLLTKEQQTNKLAGIKTISETELNYINQLLLDELARIKATKMSEEEAAAARAAAYAKYNAAIIASGGLADANFYTEKTQIELLAIARIAALDTVAAAKVTSDILTYNTQADLIAKLAAAQKLADDAKMAALKVYLAEASKPITQTITTKYVSENVGGTTVVTPTRPKSNAELASELLAAGSGAGAGTSSSMFNPYAPGNGAGFGTQGTTNYPPVTVNIAGSVLDGDDFTEKVNQAMINAQRKGYSQYAAGSLP